MANIQKTTTEYHIAMQFADGDTRTLKTPSPNLALNEDSITSCFNYAVENNILIGDKTGAALTSFETVTKHTQTVTTLDLVPLS